MTNHNTRIVGTTGAWQGKCSCKIHSSVFPNRGEAEFWITTHLDAVNRARAHLMSRSPSLKDQRDWYRKQAARDDITDEERHQWTLLADGLDHRIGKPPDDSPLF